MHKLINFTKAYWHRNKGKIAVAGIISTAAVTSIALRAGREHNAFLKEKGLYEEYYTLDEV